QKSSGSWSGSKKDRHSLFIPPNNARVCSALFQSSRVSIAQGFDAYRCCAAFEHVELLGGGFRDIDQAPARVWPAIIDAHRHALAVAQVGDLYPGAEWQLAVGGGQRVLVEALAAGGF